MGTDSIKLFNKALADRILAMDQDELIRFLGDASLLDPEFTLSPMKSPIVCEYAFGNEEILIDYWGCYAAVFAGHPEGSISSLDYLPGEEEETFLLLRPEHVEMMIKSLREHSDDLTIMNADEIDKVEEWKAFCAANTGYFVAYLFDF